MKKKIFTAMVMTWVALSATACTQKEAIQQETTQKETAVTQESTKEQNTEMESKTEANEENPSNEAADVTLDTLAAMLGMTDEESKELLGGGQENLSADRTILVGRTYQTTLFDKTTAVNTLYDDEEKINMVQAEVAELDIQECQKLISKSTGTAMKEIEKGEGGQAKGQWDFDGMQINLYQTNGKAVLEIFIPVQS